MPLPEMFAPPSDLPYQQTTLRFHDGSQRQVHWVDVEKPYPDGRLIVSRTDRDGYITHANDAFVEMSGGYTLNELIGSPHHIMRHPDMPAVVFRGLWEHCARQEKWHGYVKNLRKDGAYYWVYATVVPNIRNGHVVGYTSVRRKPSRARVNELIQVYRGYLQEEQANKTAGQLPEAVETAWAPTVIIKRVR